VTVRGGHHNALWNGVLAGTYARGDCPSDDTWSGALTSAACPKLGYQLVGATAPDTLDLKEAKALLDELHA